jgi:hypothetical protein
MLHNAVALTVRIDIQGGPSEGERIVSACIVAPPSGETLTNPATAETPGT